MKGRTSAAKQTRTVELPVGQVKVGARVRQGAGNPDALELLVRSLEDVGLLYPVLVRPDHVLIDGFRRLQAAKRLGWKTIDVRVVEGLGDVLDALRAEGDANLCRLDFLPSEKFRLGQKLEELERAAARARQVEGGRLKGSVNLTEAAKGDVREKVGQALGMSASSYRKLVIVHKAAEANPRLAPIVREMDESGSIDRGYRRFREEEAGAIRSWAVTRPASADAEDLRLQGDVARRLAEALGGEGGFNAAGVLAALGCDAALQLAGTLQRLGAMGDALASEARP
jgi:ParB-like chromosome segregation protein Spo0J